MAEHDTGLDRALGTAAAVGAAGLLAVVPQLYYLAVVAPRGASVQPLGGMSAHALLRAEVTSAAFAVVVAALSGAMLARRYGLAGVGDLASVRAARSHYLFALAVGLATYALLGRHLAAKAPSTFPVGLGWGLGRLVKGAVFEEVVARFGMMTILCGAVRRIAVANVLQAVFFTGLGLAGLRYHGIALEPTALLVASFIVTLATQVWLGALYARRGLLVAVVAHGCLGCPYLLHAVWGGP